MFIVLNDEIRDYVRSNPAALGVLATLCTPTVEFDKIDLTQFKTCVEARYNYLMGLGKRPREEYPVGDLGDSMHSDQNLAFEFTEHVLESLNYPLTSDTVSDMVDEWITRINGDHVTRTILQHLSPTSRAIDTRLLMYLAHNAR